MRINYNASAMHTNKALNRTDNLMTQSMQRLSSGLKINYAKDNPAGLAIANRMNAQIEGLGVGSRNTNDGISVVETADGALSEVTSIIQRMNELAVQAATDTKTDYDRGIIQAEIEQLQKEITRIAKDTEFNGQSLLDGTFDLKGYSDNPDVKVDYYTEDVDHGKYTVDIGALLNADGTVNLGALGPEFPNVGTLSGTAEQVFDVNGNLAETRYKILGTGGFELNLTAAAGASGTVELDITGIGAMKIQTGANEGNELAIQIRTVSLEKMGIPDDPKNPLRMDVSTQAGASNAIDALSGALEYINSVRSKLGAYQNRLEHNEASVKVSEENMTSSYSRIMDVDMAEEMTKYSTYTVMTQAGTSVLAQANDRPSTVLQLLQ